METPPSGTVQPGHAAAEKIRSRPTSFTTALLRPRDDGRPSRITSPRNTPQAKQSPPTSPTKAKPEVKTMPSTASEAVQQCEQLFQGGQAHQAIRRLDAALLSTEDTGVQHHLLTELAQELLNLADHDHPDAGLIPELKDHQGTCLGIGRAIRGMGKGGWWLPTEPFFVEPRIREVLTQLSDRACAFELIDHQVSQQLEHTQGLVEPDDFALVLDRLERLHRLASQPSDGALLARVLEHAQQLSPRLLAHTHRAFRPLKARCLQLTKACLTPDALRARYGIQSRLELQATVDDSTGQWRWTAVAYPIEPPLTGENAKHEQRKFFADIDRLLQGSPPVPWTLAAKAVTTALRKHHWVPDYGVWLSWSLREARRGNMAPMVQQLMKIEEELGVAEARKQLFLRLVEQISAGMPWHEKTAITDAVRGHEQLGWEISAHDEWALRELCAQGGDAGPMIELLKCQLPQGFVGPERLTALLALCQRTSLKASTRIDLIAAIRPHLVNAPDFHERFDAVLRSFRWRPSSRPASAVQTTPEAATTADELVRQARSTMGQWFDIDLRQASLVTVRTSPKKAPCTDEDKERFEAALLTWMNIELLQESMDWQKLLGCIDEIEQTWKATINRDRLLHLCIQHVKRTGNPKALQDHLPKLIETQPSDQTLSELLEIAGRADWSPFIRAALLPHLLAWVRPNPDVSLHLACVRAILSLPAGEVRATAIDRFLAAYTGGETMPRLFDTVALQQEVPPPPLQASLRAVSRPPADPHAWLGWRALCAALWEAIAKRLSAALTQEPIPENTSKLLFNALSTLATPASGDMTLAIPQLFDLLGDLVQAIPQDQRAAFLERLLALSLPWPGAPVVQAALRGALQALLTRERGNTTASLPPSNTRQFAIDEATVLFTHGFLYRMALQRGEDVPAQDNLHELRLRWGTTQVGSHAPEMATLIARLFALEKPDRDLH